MSSALKADAPKEAAHPSGFLRRQFTKVKPLPPGISLKGQTCIVTGSNGGLGLEACRQLLKLHASHLIMAVRTLAKGESAANELRKEFSDKDITVSVWSLDMESYDSIQSFVKKCAELPRIDLVILNAGAIITKFTASKQTGHEAIMQTNYISTALLGILLLPVLKASHTKNAGSKPSVLTFIGSDLAYKPEYVPKIQDPVLPQYDEEKSFDYFTSYSTSKLFLLFFVSKLAEEVDPADVVVNVANPGLTRGTDLARNGSLAVKAAMGLGMLLTGRSVETAASVYLDATLTRGAESHGSFLSEWTIKPYPVFWYTEEGHKFRATLWDETMAELDFAGAAKILSEMKGAVGKV